MLGTFEKARRVLDLYTPERPEWGVSEVARHLAMPTSSAQVLLASLAYLGLLHRTLAGRYRLGFKLLALNQVLLANTPWRDVAQAELRPLADRFGETVHLGALDGGQVVTVASLGGRWADSPPPPRVGAALPVHASSGGKVLLAFRSPDVVEAALRQHGLTRHTAQTLTEPGAFAADLAQVRSRGYALDLGEHHAGVCWVGAPVRNHNGEVIAAVSVGMPGERYAARAPDVREAVVSAGERISNLIGFSPLPAGEGRWVWTSVEGREQLRSAPRRRPSRPGPEDEST